MLEGLGGNILVSMGKDGVVMVDDQFAPLTVKIKDAISKLTDKPIKFVINTHRHGDHTGGNENMGEAGTIIISHDNVRKRLRYRTIHRAFQSYSSCLVKKRFTDYYILR